MTGGEYNDYNALDMDLSVYLLSSLPDTVTSPRVYCMNCPCCAC